MNRTVIRILVLAFVLLHFGGGMFFLYADIVSANGAAHRFALSRGEIAPDHIDIGLKLFWFPLGPLSSLFWALPVYGILRLIGWLLDRKRKDESSAAVV